ncbi:hypothetical protein [Paraglaciecola agarilytica]|nr:hypothetical protein [Paraglaciecola agarilytica]
MLRKVEVLNIQAMQIVEGFVLDDFRISVDVSREGSAKGIECKTQLEEEFLQLPIETQLQVLKYTALPLKDLVVTGGKDNRGQYEGLLSIKLIIEKQKASVSVELCDELKKVHAEQLQQILVCTSEYLIRIGVSLLNVRNKKARTHD